MKKKLGILVLFVTIYLVLVKIAGMGYNTYVEGDFHSTLHADAAGYNVYLTALTPFDYHDKFSDKQDEKVGYGFTLGENKKVITKYNYGVAFLQSPFYLTGKYYAKLTHKEFTGYNPYCQRLVDLAGIFYGVAGLFLLFYFLRNYFSPLISFFSVLILFFSFNILWYVIVQPGMSHVYSFFLFSLLLFTGKKYLQDRKFLIFLFLCFVAAFLVLIRPLNGIFLSMLFFIPHEGNDTLKSKLSAFLTIKNIIAGLVVVALVFTPQVIYWKFAYNEYFPDTYPNEKFTFLTNPKIFEFLFAAKSGLFMYNPIWALFIPILLILCFKSKEAYYKAVLGIFLVMMYLTAAWYEYFFGCGLGNRNFAEYSVMLVYPIAQVLQWAWTKKARLALLAPIFLFCMAINVKLTESFDMCFFGNTIWDYSEYKYLVLNKPTIKSITYEDSSAYIKNTTITQDPWNPDNKCSMVDHTMEYASTITIPVSELGYVRPRKLEFSVDINPVKTNFSCEVIVQVIRDEKQIFYQGLPFMTVDPIFQKFDFYCPLPKDLMKTDKVFVFFWNKGRHTFYTDNYRLKFR